MEERLSIAGERRTYGDVGHDHCHPYAQLILPLMGTLFLKTPGTQLALNESAIFFIPPGCQHHFYARNTNEFLTLDISPQLLSMPTAPPWQDGMRLEFSDRWRAIRTLLLADIEAPVAANSLLYLVQYMRELLASPPPSRSLQYLHQHYQQSLSIAHLAQLEGYTPSYYSEWFKAKTGQTPKAYVNDLRLHQAKQLLQHTDLPIFRIAQDVGFARASSLIRLFQQRDRLTPQQYRQNSRNLAHS